MLCTPYVKLVQTYMQTCMILTYLECDPTGLSMVKALRHMSMGTMQSCYVKLLNMIVENSRLVINQVLIHLIYLCSHCTLYNNV